MISQVRTGLGLRIRFRLRFGFVPGLGDGCLPLLLERLEICLESAQFLQQNETNLPAVLMTS